MGGCSAVQNFSLPSRSGTLRPVSPRPESSSGHRSRADRDNNSDPGSDLNLVFERNRIRSPTPTALQLFQFADEDSTARLAMSRSKGNLPRPMSTSSSAPALTAVGSMGAGVAGDGCDNDTMREDLDNGPGQKQSRPTTPQQSQSNAAANTHLSLGPISPTLSVWPRPMSVLDDTPTQNSNGVLEKEKNTLTSSVRAQRVLSNGTRDAFSDGNIDRDRDLEASITRHTANNSTYNEPPSLARSISIRWGPRLRHISLSEVQAADDAARRVAAVRRERRVFWILVVLALLGVLSCTAAVTLAAAQAAMQVGVEEIGPDPGGGGPIWDVRTLAWLVASLVVCTAAAAGLAIATSARCRRRRDGNNGAYSPTDKAILTQLIQSGRRCRRGGGPGAESRCSHRFSTLFAHQPPQHQAADGITRDTRDSRAAWVEMVDMEERSEDPNTEVMNRWWSLGRRGKGGRLTGMGVDGTCVASGEQVGIRDEDRNWLKFTQDPVRLRRYVEALEARLAVVDAVGVEGTPEAVPIDRADTTTRLPQHGVVRSPAMAVLPRESVCSPITIPGHDIF
ncbi:uncharacterized protein SPSK_10748 [Sporothrix schenckii 1099-18]|uniref:Uncharacterized protein n=1 Tax=Sporothrix schenckii 1099-18 TaxID=1397361 RepID=A0A0F2MEB6_SPOSC|nr:uncharacterized protein SPSK_10748 [Sporothrix schenckii 1099-18]KJR88018.1 hypothetical protein SPSK_10748 [Sporothrix schenckii 1099-18]